MKKNNKILTVGIAAYNMELYLSRLFRLVGMYWKS